MGKSRNGSIDLLKILLIFYVMTIHVGGIGTGVVPFDSKEMLMIYFLEAVSIPAVDTFVIISGYLLSEKKKIRISRPLELICEVIFVNLAFYLIGGGIDPNKSISVIGIIGKLIPNNYFAIFYCCLYLLIPFINKTTFSLTYDSFRRLIIILFIMLSIYASSVDVLIELFGDTFYDLSSVTRYGSGYGYTTINFIFMYLLGAFLRQEEQRRHIIKTLKKRLVLLSICLVLVFSIFIGAYFENSKEQFFKQRVSLSYCNPLVILYAICIFLLFKSFKVRDGKVIRYISSATFTSYLVHVAIIWDFVNEGTFDFYATIIPKVLVCELIMLMISLAVHFIYGFLASFFKRVGKLNTIYIE